MSFLTSFQMAYGRVLWISLRRAERERFWDDACTTRYSLWRHLRQGHACGSAAAGPWTTQSWAETT